jgi:cytochrome P450
MNLIIALLGAAGVALEWAIGICGQNANSNDGLFEGRRARAHILEAQRLFPSSWRIDRQANRVHVIGGNKVTPGEHVLIAVWLIHRSSELWDQPGEFRPDRWTGKNKIHPGAFLPFSAGPKICPARGFALDTLQRSLTAILETAETECHFMPGSDPQALPLLVPPRGVLNLNPKIH